VDHHRDHFWPGSRDIAWDLAGATVELGLGEDARAALVAAYAAQALDATIGRRLPFHLVAYAAYRMGYAALAAETLGATADGLRFARMRDGYARTLRRELEARS
jgi:hypothetical protein